MLKNVYLPRSNCRSSFGSLMTFFSTTTRDFPLKRGKGAMATMDKRQVRSRGQKSAAERKCDDGFAEKQVREKSLEIYKFRFSPPPLSIFHGERDGERNGYIFYTCRTAVLLEGEREKSSDKA